MKIKTERTFFEGYNFLNSDNKYESLRLEKSTITQMVSINSDIERLLSEKLF